MSNETIAEVHEAFNYSFHDDEIELHDFKTIMEASSMVEALEQLAIYGSNNGFNFCVKYTRKYASLTGKVLRCVSHENCPFEIHIRPSIQEDKFTIMTRFEHTNHSKLQKRIGIHPAMKNHVDNLIRGNLGPQQVLIQLKAQFKGRQNLLANLPTILQIKNRKAYLDRKLSKHTKVENLTNILEWAFPYLCNDSHTLFCGQQPQNFDEMIDSLTSMPETLRTELMVLSTFEHQFRNKENQVVNSIGFTFSSRQLILNLLLCFRDQADHLSMSTDGTYRLHFGGWTLVALGSNYVRMQSNTFGHSFVPWLFMMVRTENEFAYNKLFSTLKDICKNYLLFTIEPKFFTMDHAAYIANAVKSTWCDVIILNCWPHTKRNTKDMKKLLLKSEQYDCMVKPYINMLHLSRSSNQHKALSEWVVQHWIKNGELCYSEWFAINYLKNPWRNWFYSASGVAGILPNQNPIESFNRTIKRGQKLRVPTTSMLNKTLPSLMQKCVSCTFNNMYTNYCLSHIPAEMLATASTMLSNCKNFMIVNDTAAKLVGYTINATKYCFGSNNLNPIAVTKSRSKRYLKSLNGNVGEGFTCNDIEKLFLSMYFVSVNTAVIIQRDAEVNVWTLKLIEETRTKYKCQCKTYYTSGWICCHILVVMSLCNDVNIDDCLQQLPIRQRPGRPFANTNCLIKDKPTSSQKRKFISQFLTKPASIFGWVVAREEPCRDNDGNQFVELILGQVNKFFNGSVYLWQVTFTDGEVIEYEADELADLCIASLRNGVKLTSLTLSGHIRKTIQLNSPQEQQN